MMSNESAVESRVTAECLFIEVALPVPMRNTYTYKLDKRRQVELGVRVIVPFGRQTLTGYCVAVHEELDPELGLEESKLRIVTDVVDETALLTPEILELTRWAADYYSVSWGEMLKSSLPAGINSLIETVYRATTDIDGIVSKLPPNKTLNLITNFEITKEKELLKTIGKNRAKKDLAALVKSGALERAHEILSGSVKASKKRWAILKDHRIKPKNSAQQKVLDFLRKQPDGESTAEIKTVLDVSDSPLKTLAKAGAISLFDREVKRDPLKGVEIPDYGTFELTQDQIKATEKIDEAINQAAYKTFLVHGITGSGKTEVYIRSIKKVLSTDRTALMMVPEIALTPVFSKQLRAVFGSDVAILHSSLSAGERFDEWRRIYAGEARVVIGTRSAVFAPLSNLGLIIVDEEHDTSYRQHELPFYNGRDIAVVRAKRAGAVVILGSATPAVESYQNAIEGKYELLEMPRRVSDRPLPQASLIDMREVFD